MDRKPVVALLGTFDTKGNEYEFLRSCIDPGIQTLLIDAGTGEPSIAADISAREVAAEAGADLEDLRKEGSRNKANNAMKEGASRIVRRLFDEGKLDGIIGLGGSSGAMITSAAMRALPVGVPKLLVTTMASGDTRPYVSNSDIMMLYSVVDISGINQLSATILRNAAGAMSGMLLNNAPKTENWDKPIIGATMFGVTTPCVSAARERLEELGYEILVFHAIGIGGQTMEMLIKSGYISAVLDVTTTEMADEVAGGILSAGKQRLRAAAEAGIPQVVSVGALDMANFGPIDTVPEKYRTRKLHIHNETVTLMRTTPEENKRLGEWIAETLNGSKGKTALFLPLKGVSAIDIEGGVFFDREADDALFTAIREKIDTNVVELIEMDHAINDPEFALAMADKLDEYYRETK